MSNKFEIFLGLQSNQLSKLQRSEIFVTLSSNGLLSPSRATSIYNIMQSQKRRKVSLRWSLTCFIVLMLQRFSPAGKFTRFATTTFLLIFKSLHSLIKILHSLDFQNSKHYSSNQPDCSDQVDFHD